MHNVIVIPRLTYRGSMDVCNMATLREEELASLMLLLEEEKQNKRKKRRWCVRPLHQTRVMDGEFHMLVQEMWMMDEEKHVSHKV